MPKLGKFAQFVRIAAPAQSMSHKYQTHAEACSHHCRYRVANCRHALALLSVWFSTHVNNARAPFFARRQCAGKNVMACPVCDFPPQQKISVTSFDEVLHPPLIHDSFPRTVVVLLIGSGVCCR